MCGPPGPSSTSRVISAQATVVERSVHAARSSRMPGWRPRVRLGTAPALRTFPRVSSALPRRLGRPRQPGRASHRARHPRVGPLARTQSRAGTSLPRGGPIVVYPRRGIRELGGGGRLAATAAGRLPPRRREPARAAPPRRVDRVAPRPDRHPVRDGRDPAVAPAPRGAKLDRAPLEGALAGAGRPAADAAPRRVAAAAALAAARSAGS